MLTHTIAVADVSAWSGSSIGLGGFGIGGGGGGVSGGVGVSGPIGGQTNIGYAISSQVTETTSGRVLWAARASRRRRRT